MKNKFTALTSSESGFLSAKTALVAGVVLAGAMGGGAAVSSVTQSAPGSSPGASTDSSNICVVAAYADDNEIIAKRGNCEGVDGPSIPGDSGGDEANTSNFMRTTWDTSKAGCTTINVPVKGTLNGTIDWGDGVIEPLSENITHAYSTAPGIKNVKITGEFSGYGAYADGANCLISVDEWGSGTKTTDLSYAFAGVQNLVSVKEVPKGVTSMDTMFFNANFNADINHWDTSSVKYMGNMFRGASQFNKPLNDWDTSNVVAMNEMFQEAYAFNQDLNGWDTSNVTTMGNMFNSAYQFNGNISEWDVSNVTDMGAMFNWVENFDQDLSGWKVDNVTTMWAMFWGASSFNQDLSGWNVSNANDVGSMFDSATAMKQNISMWQLDSATQFGGFYTNSGLTAEQVPEKVRNS